MQLFDIVVVGGGAAGCMAAINAAISGRSVLIIEKNEKIGRKLYITGKGRCNVTNASSPDNHIKNTLHNARFLFGAENKFTSTDVMNFFESAGVKLKVERGNRVFPESDHAADIIDALFFTLKRSGAKIAHETVVSIAKGSDDRFSVKTNRDTYTAKAVIVATGGISYPGTGSTGDGFKWAVQFGHSVTELRPSLVGFNEEGLECKQLQGLALKNVAVRLIDAKGKNVYEDQGEMLFTHFGLSGPLMLSASAVLNSDDQLPCVADIDLKPALDEKTLDDRLIREIGANQNKELATLLRTLLPSKMVSVFADKAGIPGNTPVNTITKKQRQEIVSLLKHYRITLTGLRSIEEAIVTKGGIVVKEISPKTMESKLVEGLYFAGEILDVDAYTGGYNLQIAWSTGYVAGVSAAEACSWED